MTIGKSHRALAHRSRSTASHGCAQVCFAAAPVDRRGNRGIQWRNNKWRMRHSDDRHARRAVVVAGRRRRGARSNHGWLLLAAVVVALAATTGAAWLHEA